MGKGYINNQMKNLEVVKKVAIVSLSANIALTILKALFALLYMNFAMLSDAAHSFVDSLATAMVVVAAFVSKPDRDRQHNYGREKRESLIVLFLSVFMFATAVLLVVQGIRGLFNVQYSSLSLGLIIVAVVSILAKEALYQYTNRYAKKTGSAVLRADAWGHRTDGLSSIAVLIGFVASIFTRNDVVESIAVIVVALFILNVGYKILRRSIRQLDDSAASEDQVQKIVSTVFAVDGVKDIDKIHTRVFGNAIYADLEISVDPDLTVAESHEIVQEVHDEMEAIEEFAIKHTTVEINPYEGKSKDGK
ncbi:MAG: cation diffusion facilitator family transporter [Firmicutes bacterium]|nr:cation diffusion facilitator family transporter [Bacillota bacterium]